MNAQLTPHKHCALTYTGRRIWGSYVADEPKFLGHGVRPVQRRAFSILERGSAVVAVALSPGGFTALRTWRPRSLSAFRLVEGLHAAGIEPKTVLDVGANIGQFSRAVLGRWPPATVVAFEPQPAASDALRKVLRAEAGHTVYAVAVGAHDGDIDFHPHEYHLSSSVLTTTRSARLRFDWAGELPSIKVPIRRLDTILSGRRLTSPVVLKIDVQGYEYEVLVGARQVLQNIDAVVVEQSFQAFYENQAHPREVSDLLRQLGFYFDRVLDTRRECAVIVEADFLYRRER